MTEWEKRFKVGKWYRDAVGRKWKVLERHIVDVTAKSEVMLVRRRWHPFMYRIAFLEPPGAFVCKGEVATIFSTPNEFGWTMIYADEEDEV